MEKKTASIIGIVLGIVIIIIGIFVQGISIERYTANIGSDIKFGADFYTEMYDVTRDVGFAVNNANNTIVDAVEGVCDAIGWLIVAIGLFDVAYFVCKIVSSEQDNYNGYTVAPSIATSTTSPSVQSNTYSVTQDSVHPVATHSWRCDNCGNMRSQTPCEHCGYAEEW